MKDNQTNITLIPDSTEMCKFVNQLVLLRKLPDLSQLLRNLLFEHNNIMTVLYNGADGLVSQTVNLFHLLTIATNPRNNRFSMTEQMN